MTGSDESAVQRPKNCKTPHSSSVGSGQNCPISGVVELEGLKAKVGVHQYRAMSLQLEGMSNYRGVISSDKALISCFVEITNDRFCC